jgi:hypothetical protein
MIFIAAIAVSLDPRTTAPVAVSVVTSFLIVSIIQYAITKKKKAADASDIGDTPAAAT